MALLFAATLVGIVVQASVGFGFAFFVAPVAVAVLDPQRAVTLLLLLGLMGNALVLLAEDRRPQVEVRALAVLLVAAVPGVVLGTAIVRAVSAASLEVVIGLLILVAAAAQMRRKRLEAELAGRPAHLVVAGVAAGVLTTATSLNGPAVLMGLLALGWRGGRLRDGTAAALLGMSVLGTVAMLTLGDAGRALPPLWLLGTCVALIAVGHRVGAALFRRLDDTGHQRLAIVASVVAGVASVVVGAVS